MTLTFEMIALTPDTVKNIDVVKFEEKVLVWMAISPKGMS
jgi:hypothetical protein